MNKTYELQHELEHEHELVALAIIRHDFLQRKCNYQN